MNEDELKKLRLKKESLRIRLRHWKKRGKDTTDLEEQYHRAVQNYNDARGVVPKPRSVITLPKNSYYYRLNIEWEGISTDIIETVQRFAEGMGLTKLVHGSNTLAYEFKGNDDEFKMLKRVLNVILDVSFGSDFKIVVYGSKRLKI